MMDLDEAIQSFKDEMEKQTALGHSEHIDNLEQMSEWLKELKAYKEQSGDAISRQAVLDGLASIAKAKAKSDAQKSLMGRVMFFTEKLPSVTPQQRTGRWIQKEEEGDAEPFIIWECSECHCVDEDGKPSYKYCPQCGARMEVEE